MSINPDLFIDPKFAANFDMRKGATVFANGRFEVTRTAKCVPNVFWNHVDCYVKDNYYSLTQGDERGEKLGYTMTYVMHSDRGFAEQIIASVPLVGPPVSNLAKFWPAFATYGATFLTVMSPPVALGAWGSMSVLKAALPTNFRYSRVGRSDSLFNLLTAEEQEIVERVHTDGELIAWLGERDL